MTSTYHLKARQTAKMREIGEALVAAGYDNLDNQAAALGLSRSTTWTIIKATHKSSGLSGTTLRRVLSAPGAVAELVGIEGGVVSGVINLESSGVEASDWRPRHDEPYHEG